MYKSINSTLGKQRQEDQAFKIILGVICQHEASDQEEPLTNINRHPIGVLSMSPQLENLLVPLEMFHNYPYILPCIQPGNHESLATESYYQLTPHPHPLKGLKRNSLLCHSDLDSFQKRDSPQSLFNTISRLSVGSWK